MAGGPDTARGRDRLLALVLAAAIAFSPPLLSVFGRGGSLFGLPLLYVYIFAAWALLIGLLALYVERGQDGGQDGEQE